MQIRTAAFLCLTIVGCASVSTEPGKQAYMAGNYDQASALWSQCAREGFAPCMHNMGYLYESGWRQQPNARNLSIGWYTLAARHGQAESRVELVRLGAPVPSPDLAMTYEPSQAELDAAASVGGLIGTAIGGGFRKR